MSGDSNPSGNGYRTDAEDLRYAGCVHQKLEQDFQVTIVDRNGSVMITGEEETFRRPSVVLRQLTALSDHGNGSKRTERGLCH